MQGSGLPEGILLREYHRSPLSPEEKDLGVQAGPKTCTCYMYLCMYNISIARHLSHYITTKQCMILLIMLAALIVTIPALGR